MTNNPIGIGTTPHFVVDSWPLWRITISVQDRLQLEFDAFAEDWAELLDEVAHTISALGAQTGTEAAPSSGNRSALKLLDRMQQMVRCR